MPTRAERAVSDAKKAERAAALTTIAGGPLPLPTDPRVDPAAYDNTIPTECLALAACGLSDVEIAAHLAISIERLEEWAEAHPALADVLSRARTAAEAWWEEKARRAVITGDNRFPAATWVAIMRARFARYRERVEINHRIDLRQLVMVDLRDPGLLGEQGVIEGEAMQAQGSSDFRAVGRPAIDPPPPSPNGAGSGGVGEKRDRQTPDTGRSPNAYPPPPEDA